MPTQTITPPAPSATSAADRVFDAVFRESLQFRIEMPYDAAVRFIERVHRYNEFDASTVIEALENIDRLIPRSFYGDGNPNNGQRTYDLSVGREGSPVIYLQRFEFQTTPPLPESIANAICNEMKLIGRADEADVDVHDFGWGRRIRFRFWWG